MNNTTEPTRDELISAIIRLRLQAQHYRNTGKGVRFLNDAIDGAIAVVARTEAPAESGQETQS